MLARAQYIDLLRNRERYFLILLTDVETISHDGAFILNTYTGIEIF